MAAPAGLCASCGSPLQWSVPDSQEGILVRCRYCADLFEDGTYLAGEVREGHETETLRGRPIRSVSQIAMDHSFCEEGE